MRILVFEQNGSGQDKIAGLQRYGQGMEVTVVSIDAALPEFVDNPEEFIPSVLEADLVVDYLTHPDLSDFLLEQCQVQGIVAVAPGKRRARGTGVYTPFTCCGLGHHTDLGRYGKRFGTPELEVELDEDGRLAAVQVRRGAPCAATWEALKKILGMKPAQAAVVFSREVQFCCAADTSGWDPLTGRSPVHFAGHVHAQALEKAVHRATGHSRQETAGQQQAASNKVEERKDSATAK
jgi:hypothetical protein